MDQAQAQQTYYERTAAGYDHAHVKPGDEHYIALEYAIALATMLGCTSLLDVGAGTGRALKFIRDRSPEIQLIGVEPAEALREQAVADLLDVRAGSGEALPFANEEFDAVIATGVLHHVPDPAPVVAEMMRVCKRLLVVSDSNRFGQGSTPARAAKVLIHKARLWPAFETARTRGKRYMESVDDGIFYSYSVFDSLPTVSSWADRAFVVPTDPQRPGFFGPITSSPHAALVGVREPQEGWAGLP